MQRNGFELEEHIDRFLLSDESYHNIAPMRSARRSLHTRVRSSRDFRTGDSGSLGGNGLPFRCHASDVAVVADVIPCQQQLLSELLAERVFAHRLRTSFQQQVERLQSV